MKERLFHDLEKIRMQIDSSVVDDEIYGLDKDLLLSSLRKLYDAVQSLPTKNVPAVLSDIEPRNNAASAPGAFHKQPVFSNPYFNTAPKPQDESAGRETEPQHDKIQEAKSAEEPAVIEHEHGNSEAEAPEQAPERDTIEEMTLNAEPIIPQPSRLDKMMEDEESLAARLGRERFKAVADELCGGDTDKCVDMMTALEATGDFDLAILLIQDNYPVKPDSTAIDMLVEVLSAKFM
ncbi:MAG: hypothetical protein K2F53_00680 [Rikenellaceae bacterium]|nr:hypothetical protein [Rikenellaceae bacterium]MDE7355536.1 hypothetical protein [Rikenellaceae bacterium]